MGEEEQYQKVANRKDLKEGGLLKIEPNGKSILLAVVNGKVYAMDSICSLEGGPLETTGNILIDLQGQKK
jgi:nitrite reductase/ring-hydroxylating ferredoxin subunit